MSTSFNKNVLKAMKAATQGYLSFDRTPKGMLRADLSENVFGPSPKVLRYLKDRTYDISKYPVKQTVALRQAISKRYEISQDHILVSSGIDTLISIIVHGCTNPGETVVAVVPTFYRLLEWSRLGGLDVVKIPLRHADQFEFTDQTRDAVVAQSRKADAKIVWLCNPNNPAGTVIPLSHIRQIAQSLPNSWIIVDEAFYESLGENNNLSARQLLKKLPNVVVLRTLSKYGLASIRCGFLMGNKKLVRYLSAIASPFAISGISAELAVVALSDQKYIKSIAAKTRVLRNELTKNIRSLPSIELGSDSQTNVILLRHKTNDLFSELKKQKILSADFRNIEGLEGMGFVRITIQREGNNKKIVAALKKIH